jgi:hypothetical protein
MCSAVYILLRIHQDAITPDSIVGTLYGGLWPAHEKRRDQSDEVSKTVGLSVGKGIRCSNAVVIYFY